MNNNNIYLNFNGLKRYDELIKEYINDKYKYKQDIIEDLDDIRYKSTLGANALSEAKLYIDSKDSKINTRLDILESIDYKQINADEEDLTNMNGLIKIADRGTLYGKGYKIIRRGVDLQSQFNQENTIYEIRYDFELNGETLNIPAGCTLKFEGGSFANGIIDGVEESPTIIGYGGLHCNITDVFKIIHTSWFGLNKTSEPAYNSTIMNNLVNPLKSLSKYRKSNPIVIVDDSFTMDRPLTVMSRINMTSQSSSASSRCTISFPDSEGIVWRNSSDFYSSSNKLSNINIFSKGNCIDFGDRTIISKDKSPINVYYSTFSNMCLTSLEGSCVYRKDNGQGVFSTVY